MQRWSVSPPYKAKDSGSCSAPRIPTRNSVSAPWQKQCQQSGVWVRANAVIVGHSERSHGPVTMSLAGSVARLSVLPHLAGSSCEVQQRLGAGLRATARSLKRTEKWIPTNISARYQSKDSIRFYSVGAKPRPATLDPRRPASTRPHSPGRLAPATLFLPASRSNKHRQAHSGCG